MNGVVFRMMGLDPSNPTKYGKLNPSMIGGAVINTIAAPDDYLIGGRVGESKARTELFVVSIGKSILSSSARPVTEDHKSARMSVSTWIGQVRRSSSDIRLATSCGGVGISQRKPKLRVSFEVTFQSSWK